MRAIVLYRYEGGTITAGDVFDAASQLKYKTLDLRNKKAVIEHAEGTLVPDALFVEAALREGLDREKEVTQWLARKREQELVVQLRVQVLKERVSISTEDIRREYEENPNRYMQPDQIEIQEILVASEEEAKDLLERLRRGASMGRFGTPVFQTPSRTARRGGPTAFYGCGRSGVRTLGSSGPQSPRG